MSFLMLMRLFLQYNHIEKDDNQRCNNRNYCELEKHRENVYTAV